MELYGSHSGGLDQALKDAERRSAKTGDDAALQETLECAKAETDAAKLRAVWQGAKELKPSSDRLFQTIYARSLRKMLEVLELQNPVDVQVAGHALVRAAELGYFNVVKILRKALSELTASTLVWRFKGFALLKAVDSGSLDVVQELLRSLNLAGLALMGYELAMSRDEGYPFVRNNLTKKWRARLASVKSLLPHASPVMQYSAVELHGSGSNEEEVHEATRACFRTYFLWRLIIVAAANSQVSVFREVLRRIDEQQSVQSSHDRQSSCGGDIMRNRVAIEEEFLRYALKITAKLQRDHLCYDLWRRTDEARAYGYDRTESEADAESRWRCTARSMFGVWEITMQVPTLMTEIEAAYNSDNKHAMRRYKYVKPLLPQMTNVAIQFKIAVEIGPNFIELTVGINHVRVHVENASWDEKKIGHFPSRVELKVIPATSGGNSVSMTCGSSNTAFKVGVSEQIRAGVHVNIGKVAAGGLTLTAGATTSSKIESKPWNLEQLPVHGDRGGSFIWTLESLRGTEFQRLNPELMAAKSSIFQFGRRIPINPLTTLPFTSNGGINFTGSEFNDTLAWRFPKELENTEIAFDIEGLLSTTHMSQTTFWETRVLPFEARLSQKLEPCGDPSGGDKKKKKKK